MTLRILVVDDDEKSRRLAADVLEHHGYAVTRAANGEEALAQARAALQDLVLLDLQLPGIGGAATLRALRGLPGWGRVPMIAVTASVLARERSVLLREGFDGVLAKPLAIKDLARLVRDTLAASGR